MSRTRTACPEPCSEHPSGPRLASTSQGDGSLGARERRLNSPGGSGGARGGSPLLCSGGRGRERTAFGHGGRGRFPTPHGLRQQSQEAGSADTHAPGTAQAADGSELQHTESHGAASERAGHPRPGHRLGCISLPYPCADSGDTSPQKAAERRFTQPISKPCVRTPAHPVLCRFSKRQGKRKGQTLTECPPGSRCCAGPCRVLRAPSWHFYRGEG